jgi:3-dehydroquinate synthase
MRTMLEAHLDRQSFVIIVGGGAVMDAVGLAAALVHRGLRQIRVPTTVLGQNDAGVGVKNGVNYLGGKNALGTFAPPFAVLNDFDFLLTLPDRDWLCGVAEAFKVSIIRDRAFFEDLVASAEKYPARDFAAMKALVIRCAEIHLEHIRTNGDPFEYGRARPLDFGHWSAHKLELLSNFRVSHGEAVAAGVLLDSNYAALKSWIAPTEAAAIRAGLKRSGFQLWFDEFELREADGTRAIFGGLRDFQEHLGGELTVTFPRGLGARQEVHEIDLAMMERALQELRASAPSR